ncbi:hypothetical protein RCS94_08435 [Orbaceae bacterium ac157xtp]
MFTFSVFIAPLSYGALSAISANTIKGNAPTFTGQSGNNKLGFTVDGIHYSEGENNIFEGTIKNFNAGLKISDFVVTDLTVSDFDRTTDYYDADGDTAHPTSAFTMDSVTYEWRDGNDDLITDDSQTLGCGSSLVLPLTLKIKLLNVRVQSANGDPRLSDKADLVKTYTIGSDSGICFAKPYGMIHNPYLAWTGYTDTSSVSAVYNWTTGSRHPQLGGGYDTSQFDPVNGFKASLTPRFPTTGFSGAKFQLIMTSPASDWIFTSKTPGIGVSTDGIVGLSYKPSIPAKIEVTLKSDPQVKHYYIFDPRETWFVVKSDTNWYTYNEAKSACGGESKIPTVAQLTNAPIVTISSSTPNTYNTYTRAIGSVFGEWGYCGIYGIGPNSVNYPGSAWMDGGLFYWSRSTKDGISTRRFAVRSGNGNIFWEYTNYVYKHLVACLE